MPDSFDGFHSLWLEAVPGGVGLKVCIHAPAIFKNVFDVKNFSIISKLFDSITPYASSTHNRKYATKMHHFGKGFRIRVKKLKQNLPENYTESTKIAITACKFSKFFRRYIPPDPLKPFLFLNQLQICSAKKI